jgi:helicase
MRGLEVWGVPSYMVDIWEKNYSPYLLPVQEKAVRYYGVSDYEEGKIYPHPALSPQGRGLDGNQNLLVIAPTSSGKTFIREMAAITQAIHKKKTIYLVPLRSLAEEKYHHLKDLYANCNINTLISSRDRREDDKKIIKGDYQIAIMVYEKFNYFLLKYPQLLKGTSLIIIDELQMIHDPSRGLLLEGMIEYIRKKNPKVKLIGLSAYLENEAGFLNWLPTYPLLSYQRPVELRKGILREGTFRYITHNKNEYGEEEFFSIKEGQDISYEDCLTNTISYFMENNEPTLLFFPTKKETRRWAVWLAEEIDAPRANQAIAELSRMEETRSRDELLYLLEKGIAYHNADLSWEERNLIESYLKKGEIKLICATTTLAMGINLPFKNVILSSDKYVSDDGDYKNSYRTSLSLADVENMGGKAGRLNWGKDEFGRVIFLVDSLFSETVLQNVYFKLMKENKKIQREVINEDSELYIPSLKSKSHQLYRPIKKEKDFTTFLLTQHSEQVMSYNELLDKLWKDEEDAIYNRVSFHISKVRRTILKIIEIKSG